MEGLKMKYFVLKPEGEDPYSRASRMAMGVYAEAIKEFDKPLADALWEWLNRLNSQEKAKLLKVLVDHANSLDW